MPGKGYLLSKLELGDNQNQPASSTLLLRNLSSASLLNMPLSSSAKPMSGWTIY